VLGVSVLDVDAASAARLGLRSGAGVLVKTVRAGSAAQRAGIQPGDLLTRVGPYGIRQVSDLAVLDGARAGLEIPVRVVRITRGRVLQAEVLIVSS
jgi:S1-C subfamily serine protease